MAPPLFDDLTDAYEAMIDWPKRLANESPFFFRIFAQIGARRVLDAACGPGRHAAMFHGHGLEVEGADLSPKMIAKARADFGEPPGLRWVVRSFDQPVEAAEPFDAVVCTGNSLALAGDLDAASRAVRCMADALRPGGMLVIQVLNLWRLADGPCRWQKCAATKRDGGEALIVKGVHRCGSQGYLDIVVIAPGEPPAMQTESAPLLGIEPEFLVEAARAAGVRQTMLLGDYQERPYQRASSVDLILIGQK